MQELTENLRTRLAARDKPLPCLTPADAIIQSLIHEARYGKIDAIKFIFDRIDGPASPMLIESTAEGFRPFVSDQRTAAIIHRDGQCKIEWLPADHPDVLKNQRESEARERAWRDKAPEDVP
jgi:hypothetical protein